jgi:hypothetical protein
LARRNEFIDLDCYLLPDLRSIDAELSNMVSRDLFEGLTLFMRLASSPDEIGKGVAMIAARAVEYDIDSGAPATTRTDCCEFCALTTQRMIDSQPN